MSQLVCDTCGRQFDNAGAKAYHENNCTEENHYSEAEIDELMDSVDVDGLCLYVLELRREDGESFFYVGVSDDLRHRLRHHTKYDEIAMPDPESGEYRRGVSFDVVSVERTIACDDRDEANRLEREVPFEVCLERETTNILGGDGRSH